MSVDSKRQRDVRDYNFVQDGHSETVRWVEWRCDNCHYYLSSYNPNVPCHMHRVCPKCGSEQTRDRRITSAPQIPWG